MDAAQFQDALRTLNWSARYVASIGGYNRSLGTQWASGRSSIPPRVSDWLTKLVAAHKSIGPLPPVTKPRRSKDQERMRAHGAVLRALKTGQLQRQPCEFCGERVEVEAHHDDYSKPLDVRWLCPKHHRDLHVLAKRDDAAAHEAALWG